MHNPIDATIDSNGKLVAAYITLFPRARMVESRILLDRGGTVIGDFDRRGRLIGVEIIGPGKFEPPKEE